MKLDVASVGGIAFGVLALVAGFVLEGGKAGSLLEGTAAIIVFGGTFAATFVSFSLQAMRRVPHHLSVAFHASAYDPVALIDELCEATKAYRDPAQGFHALEERAHRSTDRFLARGYTAIADGQASKEESTEFRDGLETDLWAEYEALQEGARIFGTAGGYAPTMGIAGTVMGLIRVLGLLNGGAAALGAAIGLAFIATLYGVGSANLVWLPLSTNLKTKAGQTLMMRQIALDGLLGIAAKTNPLDLRRRLLAHIEATVPAVASASAPTGSTSAKPAVIKGGRS